MICSQSLKVLTSIREPHFWLTSDVDEIPDLAELLREPSRPEPTIALSESRPSHALPTYLHRASVRATTFDGKTFYMKRKTKIDGFRNVRAFLVASTAHL